MSGDAASGGELAHGLAVRGNACDMMEIWIGAFSVLYEVRVHM